MIQQQKTHPVDKIRENYNDKIKQLHQIFTDPALETFLDKSNSVDPLQSIEDFLDKIDECLLDANDAKYMRAFRRFITELECFKLRAVSKNRKQHVWNPLDECFSDFVNRINDCEIYFTNEPYPTTEIVLAWLDQSC
ncbi:hypothetical protein [Suttonella ornithocola]|uniref:Uncharacterized protein n=1 Tax=Suttonella ornithocola TaxID=279832 RepID=A0A380MVN4_9GAMM|nr:hypothetical protein [Suttonella ornithocola]SUO96625.1 Uncharacterised protein [Suttonella ornithocola]